MNSHTGVEMKVDFYSHFHDRRYTIVLMRLRGYILRG